MTDRMTLPEAREWLVDYVNVMFLSNTSTRRFRQILALLDHLAARVEAGEGLAERVRVSTAHAIWIPDAAIQSRAIEQADAALARWEGLRK